MNKPKRYLITAALPYANGPLHIGHIAGAYLPADIFVRYLRLKGEDVKFVCGSDEHGIPITLRALKEHRTPQQVVDTYHHLNSTTFARFGISFDIFHRTSDPLHHETASAFFKRLYDKGELMELETDQFYDEEAKQFLADRYIEGTCPNCGNERAYGDQCEKCGKSLSPDELLHPRSMLSGKPPVKRKTVHWFLPLDKYQKQWLEAWIEGRKDHWKPNVYGQCRSWLDQGLQPRAITRDLDWGVSVPLPQAKGKVLYVWFDAPIGYISATRALTDDWEKYWKHPDTRLIHFIGKDNIVFHCIIFPAMLKAHGEYILPDDVPANEFLNLEGNKLSTSRNWAVWLHEYLDENPGKEDVLRYVLCSIMPETKDSEFTWKDYQARNNNELVAILGNFVNRVMVLTGKFFENRVPPADACDELKQLLLQQQTRVEESLEHFRFREALQEVMQVVRHGNKLLTENEPWKLIKTHPQQAGIVLHDCLQLIANIAILIEPFLPFTARTILKMLNLDISVLRWENIGRLNLLTAGHRLGAAELLFEKIEDQFVVRQTQKLYGNAQPKAAASEAEKRKPLISYDDFAKLDLRVGKILSAEKVEKADKLLRLLVDLGNEQRTIVSGIAPYFHPEDIIGKKVSVVANLAPKKIRGIESHGMILLAENKDGRLAFVSPAEEAQEGSEIK
ncbi:MAG: methionine--tRNA ligase [Chitinophagales bacterium]|nr:MAG: methionine--tRNA ligase [Chitinophagales bacterium]